MRVSPTWDQGEGRGGWTEGQLCSQLPSKGKVKVTVTQPCSTLGIPMDYICPWNSPGQNTGVGSLCLLQQIFTIQESNQGPLHCRWILYQLSYHGSPTLLKVHPNLGISFQAKTKHGTLVPQVHVKEYHLKVPAAPIL